MGYRGDWMEKKEQPKDVHQKFLDMGLLETRYRITPPIRGRVILQRIVGHMTLAVMRKIIFNRKVHNRQLREYFKMWIEKLDRDDHNCGLLWNYFTTQINAGRKHSTAEERDAMGILRTSMYQPDNAHKGVQRARRINRRLRSDESIREDQAEKTKQHAEKYVAVFMNDGIQSDALKVGDKIEEVDGERESDKGEGRPV